MKCCDHEESTRSHNRENDSSHACREKLGYASPVKGRAGKIRRASAQRTSKSDEGRSLFDPSLRPKHLRLVLACHERHPKVPVGARPWTLPRGREVPCTRTRSFYASSCCRVNARFWCSIFQAAGRLRIARHERAPKIRNSFAASNRTAAPGYGIPMYFQNAVPQGSGVPRSASKTQSLAILRSSRSQISRSACSASDRYCHTRSAIKFGTTSV